MAFKLADLVIGLSLDSSGVKKGLAGVEGDVKSAGGRMGSIMTGVFQGVGQAIFGAVKVGVGAAVNEIGKAVTASSNLNEVVSKTNATFGSAAASVLEWSKTSATAFGLSQRAALDVTAGLGNMFIQLGSGRKEAAALSQGMVELAADIASFHNVAGGAEEVSEAMASAFRGEYDALQRYIPTISAAAVEQRALAMTGKDTAAALSQLDKALAVQELIMRGAGAATGDFDKTSRELANSQRILAAQMEDGAARIGGSFRPAVTAITNLISGLAPQMFTYAQNITDQFANGLAAGIRAIIPVITTIRQLFTYWFQPGSPPKILPDIDKWGKGTMQAWLDGMASIDVKAAFDTVGKAVEGILRSFVGAGKMDEGALVGSIFGSRDAIAKAVAEFRKLGSVSEATIKQIAASAGPAGAAISTLVKTYFELQRASEKVKTAQDALNRTTAQYDAIIDPLRGKLDDVRGQQQALANQQRLISAKNTLNNIDSTASEKRDAALEIEAIALEEQIRLAEDKKEAAVSAGQAAVDTATKEQEAAKLQLDAAQATIDRQVETNNLLGEQKRLVEQLAAAQEAAAQKAQSAAEATANKATAAAERAQREAEQLQAAQLRYNLEISDTPGKIALMEAELAKLTPGTADYFDTLTRISQLQEQYKNELEQTAKAAGALGLTDIGPGLDTGIIQPLNEVMKAGEGVQNLAKALEEAFAPVGPASKEVQKLAETLNIFGVAVTNILTAMGILKEGTALSLAETGGYWATFAGAVEGDIAKVDAASLSNVEKMTANVAIITALISGNWAEAWRLYKEYAMTAYSEVDTDTETKLGRLEFLFNVFHRITKLTWGSYWEDIKFLFTTATTAITTTVDGWATSLTTAIDGFGQSMYDAGAGLLDNFWDGLKAKWTDISTWFSSSLQGLRNQLPFSEPKDASSPLRNLGKSGESMINMIQDGMAKASLSVQPLADGLLPATAGATTNNSTSYGPVTINMALHGDVPDRTVDRAKNVIIDGLRSAGVIS